jgi:hypothetical protein
MIPIARPTDLRSYSPIRRNDTPEGSIFNIVLYTKSSRPINGWRFIPRGHTTGESTEGEKLGRMENARRMKADGMDIALIAKYTELPIEEIEKLE